MASQMRKELDMISARKRSSVPRVITATLCAGIVLALAGCSSPAQSLRDSAPAFEMNLDSASDAALDLYGRTACDGGREALGRLLVAESSDRVDIVFALATAAYCPE